MAAKLRQLPPGIEAGPGDGHEFDWIAASAVDDGAARPERFTDPRSQDRSNDGATARESQSHSQSNRAEVTLAKGIHREHRAKQAKNKTHRWVVRASGPGRGWR